MMQAQKMVAGGLVDAPLKQSEPPLDCGLCPRLAALRESLQDEQPDWWNAPVPAWGDSAAWMAILGLAPGLKGANRTGRPFTGDASGDLLFATLDKAGMSQGKFESRADDGVQLSGCMILNVVKCLPPENKPTLQEAQNCRRFLTQQLSELRELKVYVALGKIAHDSFIRHIGGKLSHYKFGHLAQHTLPDGRILIDSYHCSRYNTQTGRLTPKMFDAVFEKAKKVRNEPTVSAQLR